MEPKRMWVKDRLHLLSPANLEKVKSALVNGCIFGHHYHYYGGSAFTIWAYSDFSHFGEYISQSRPGDLYVIWSTTQLMDRNMALAWAQYNENIKLGIPLISEIQMHAIEKYLDEDRNEIISVLQRPDKSYARMYERDELVDFVELLPDFTQPGGKVFVFPMKDIDTKDHILVQAKYPNENGEVPIGGAY
jgi:hypothetical protein